MAEETKEIALLCGANGTGKSTIAKQLKLQGYEIFDVDKSNFDTSQKIEQYYQHFSKHPSLKSKKINREYFEARFKELYDKLNQDASLVLFTMYEELTGTKTEGYEEREKAIDDLYKQVMAPVYKEDTLRNIIKALYVEALVKKYTEKELPIIINNIYKAVLYNTLQATIESLDIKELLKQPNKICIDVGSRKFFFVDELFLDQLKQFGYEPQVIFLDIDLDKNVNNLFNKHDGTFVLFDRLNLTGVVINCLLQKPEIETDLKKILTPTEGIELKEFIKIRNKQLTELIQDNECLFEAVKTAIKTYMEVRHETLKEHLRCLTDHLSEKEKPLTITIEAEDGTEEVFKKLFKELSPLKTPSEYALIEPPTKLSMEVSKALNGAEALELGAEASESEAEASKLGAEASESEAKASESEAKILPKVDKAKSQTPAGTTTPAICVMPL